MKRHGGKYNPDYKELYPDSEISEEVMAVLKKSDRKMRYMEVDLKREKFISNQERQIAKLVPGREDSFDRLCDEENQQFASTSVSSEEAVIHSDEIKRLKEALKQLGPDERKLINALYYEGISESALGEKLGISQQAVSYRAKLIYRKLKNFLKN